MFLYDYFLITVKREKITEEKDIALFDSYEFINPANNTPIRCYVTNPATNKIEYLNIKVWSIDRERNAFLKELGGGLLKYQTFMLWSGTIM